MQYDINVLISIQIKFGFIKYKNVQSIAICTISKYDNKKYTCLKHNFKCYEVGGCSIIEPLKTLILTLV